MVSWWKARWRRLAALAAASVIGLALALIGARYLWHRLRYPPDPPIVLTPTPLPRTPDTLALLVQPFGNETGDPAKGYLADALTVLVTRDAARIRGLVALPTVTARRVPQSAAIQEVGQYAGVNYVLKGVLVSAGTGLRWTAQLADVRTGATVWNESFDGSPDQPGALAQRLTAKLADSVGRSKDILALRPAQQDVLDADGADLMLRAIALDSLPVTPKRLEDSEALLRQVVAKAPRASDALAELAVTLMEESLDFESTADVNQREARFREGRELAQKAKALDPGDADAYLALGLDALAHRDLRGAQNLLESAIWLDPSDARRYAILGSILAADGQPARALEILQRGLSLDPKHPPVALLYNLGRAEFLAGNNEPAIGWLHQALQVQPELAASQVLLALACAAKGDTSQAATAKSRALALIPQLHQSLFFDPPDAMSSAEYRTLWKQTIVPAWHTAGLPD